MDGPLMRGFLLGCLVMGVLLVAKGNAHFKPGTVHNRKHAITFAFCKSLKPCPLGNEAISVARCESGLWPYARNGQYLGMFQFGAFARAKYGFRWGPWHQARYAYLYWLDAGWSPWSCRP